MTGERWPDERMDDFKETMDRRLREQSRLTEAHIDALRREQALVSESSQTAITKSEAATEKRFQSVNEWRAQSQDRERTTQENISTVMGTFIPREVVEARMSEFDRKLDEIDRTNTTLRGQEQGAY